MSEKIANAKSFPKIYFGLHMGEGVAQYRKPGKAPETILIREATLKQMDPSFSGRPYSVGHVEDADDVAKLEELSAGYVIKSFFNPPDGKHWVQFIVTTDEGHDAIKKGWKLSNCYTPTQFGPAGEWHGVPYVREILAAEYDHLAGVDDPRYEESVILDEEEFKAYNAAKLAEIADQRILNSKGEKKMGLKFWKREKIENAKELDIESLSVELPLSKKEMTIGELVTAHDKVMNMNGYANGDHMVKAGDSEMTVNQLAKKFNAATAELAEMKKASEAKENASDDEDSDDMENEDDKDREDEIEKQKGAKKENVKNAKTEETFEDDMTDASEEDAEEEREKIANAKAEKAKKKANFDRIANAADRAREEAPVARVSLLSDKVARGKELF